MDKKMWGILVHLGKDGQDIYNNVDKAVWDEIVEGCIENNINTIVLSLAGGVRYASHPELAEPNAWTREEIRFQVKRLKESGITLIPKLNFSTSHGQWLKEYTRMISTNTYYKVCRELISEVYTLFDSPKYIHLGMDEEDAAHQKDCEYAVYRQGELKWHDFQYLCDCVRDTGATPWVWADFYMDDTEEFKARIRRENIILSPWYYNSIKPEHYTPIASRAEYVEHYAKNFPGNNFTYVEEEPFCVNFLNKAPHLAKDGYKIVPCVSTINQCVYNTPELAEYFKELAPDELLYGYITAPWIPANKENIDVFKESVRLLNAAREAFYNG
ncbi:MAG: hypothetical protein M0R40_06350 [Firmicutes bacterium]|nr:hypothetical protein [Bacillota bacterium]